MRVFISSQIKSFIASFFTTFLHFCFVLVGGAITQAVTDEDCVFCGKVKNINIHTVRLAQCSVLEVLQE